MTQIIIFAIVIFCAMFVQALTGFGGPLLAMPLGIVLLGLEISRPVVTVIATLAALMVAVPMYKYINWKKLLLMAGVMMAGVVLGDIVIGSVSSLTPLLIFYAAVVFFIGMRRLFFPKAWTISKPLQGCALGVAGIMQGLFISGGSFLVLYAVEQFDEKNEFRATVSAVWPILNAYLMTKYAFTGTFTLDVLKICLIVFLPALAAIILANIMARKLDQQAFLKITYAVLAVSGVVLFINSIL